MRLHFTPIGWLYISPEDDCRAIVDAMLTIDYDEEFCIAEGFDPEFTAKLMEAGFLVMSVDIGKDGEPDYIMLPKLHLERSVLFFEDLHIKKSIRRFLNRYELRADAEFDRIVDRCGEKHESDWLTPPLVDCIKKIRRSALYSAALDSVSLIGAALNGGAEAGRLEPTPCAYPASFALYRDGKLAAGEFGVICGKVYTSYSGFYEEDNAGTVQIILTARYLQEHGFSFFDLGMPMDYKTSLGAVDINPQEFVRLFRA
jgi:Leu/Phe-tRNA-protein transferase